jgi:hypothetical protein
MAVDIDEYLNQTEVGFTQESLNDMSDYGRHGFGRYGFGSYDAYNNNSSMDPFSNMNPFSDDATGGQGSLSFSNINDQQDFLAPAGLDDHSFSHNSEPAYGHQASAPSGLDGHSSHDAEQSHDPSAMLIDGEFGDVADSVEQGQNSREEEFEKDEVPLKNEEHDSDEEFKEEDAEDEAYEEDQDDEEDEGSKKKKTKEKRKPYKNSRILTRWDSKSA